MYAEEKYFLHYCSNETILLWLLVCVCLCCSSLSRGHGWRPSGTLAGDRHVCRWLSSARFLSHCHLFGSVSLFWLPEWYMCVNPSKKSIPIEYPSLCCLLPWGHNVSGLCLHCCFPELHLLCLLGLLIKFPFHSNLHLVCILPSSLSKPNIFICKILIFVPQNCASSLSSLSSPGGYHLFLPQVWPNLSSRATMVCNISSSGQLWCGGECPLIVTLSRLLCLDSVSPATMVVTTLGQQNVLDFPHYSGPLRPTAQVNLISQNNHQRWACQRDEKREVGFALSPVQQAARNNVQGKILGSLWEATRQWIIIDTKWIELN